MDEVLTAAVKLVESAIFSSYPQLTLVVLVNHAHQVSFQARGIIRIIFKDREAVPVKATNALGGTHPHPPLTVL